MRTIHFLNYIVCIDHFCIDRFRNSFGATELAQELLQVRAAYKVYFKE